MGVQSEARKIRKVVLSTVIGGTFEWFDSMAYAYFSSIIAPQFFSTTDRRESLLLAFAALAVGFLMRPIGGIMMGLYADRVGRVKALSMIMVAMSGGSLLLGLTPGASTLGLVAPLLLVVARLVHGFAVGGQFALSSVTIYEVAPAGKKMFYGSFNMLSISIATMLSAGSSYFLSTHLSHGALEAWGWRVPFLVGALVGPIGFYIRHHIGESNEFLQMRAHQAVRLPLGNRARDFVHENGDALLCAVGVMIAGTSLSYVWKVYLPNFAQAQLHLSLSSSLQGIIVMSMVSCVVSPLFGKLADRVGAYRLFFFFIGGWLTCVFPLFWFLLAEPTTRRLMMVQAVGELFLALQGAAHPGMLVQIFTVQGRSVGVAIAYNTAVTLFGGLAPFYISLISQFTDARYIPPSYLFCTGLVAVLLVLATRTGRRVLQEDRMARRSGAIPVSNSPGPASVECASESTGLRS
ncbi:MHS family proline/betaine transporter-like MFS transporter [Caballeronia udeis]|uniref:MHS family proline/betaine transporter-like MFS transporter n=1 Tax=Caballeronia udeis TaxID=1232866 RepID=A0ABW8MUG6_9BURK